MCRHIFVRHPVTGKCLVCCLESYNSLHIFVQFPTHPVTHLYERPVENKEAKYILHKVEAIIRSSVAKKCEACE